MKMRKITPLSALIVAFALSFGQITVSAADISKPDALAASVDSKERQLLAGGMPFGVRMFCEGVLVVGIGDVSVGNIKKSPARDAGICVSDVIYEIDGIAVESADQVARAIASGEGRTMQVELERDGERMSVELTPALCDKDGKPKTGLWIRDSAAGIGTVTYIDPETGEFAGLGHGICDADTGELMPMGRGIVVGVTISEVVKGSAGSPGELVGRFSQNKLGTLTKNTERGVFGFFAELPKAYDGSSSEMLTTCDSSEVRPGEAEILCTVGEGGIGSYKVKLSEIDRSGGKVKNFVVTVTDERLLAATGGIVQGMSGSPIIQNGKLVGAVTHVLVNDPTRGYGIFIGNMLDAAA